MYDKNYKSAVKNTKENDIVNWAKYYTSEVIMQSPTFLLSHS